MEKQLYQFKVGVFLGTFLTYILLNKYQDNSKVLDNLGETL